MGIPEKKQKLLEDLSKFSGKDERFQYIISLGKKHPGISPDAQEDKFLIKGCLSKAWLVPQFDGKTLHFDFDSEAIIVKGIMAVLMEVYNDNPPAENLQLDPNFLNEAGITEHLSMNRRNGLANFFKQIQLYSMTFKALQSRAGGQAPG